MSASPAAAPSRLTAEARRSLALLAGGDLSPADAAAARGLAETCPHCRGHFESVRDAVDVLSRHEVAAPAGGLWPAVREGLTVAEPATEPAAPRWAMPTFAVTAAALLVGAFAFAPAAGEALPGWFQPSGTVRPAGQESPVRPEYKTFPRPDAADRGTMAAPPAPGVRYPR